VAGGFVRRWELTKATSTATVLWRWPTWCPAQPIRQNRVTYLPATGPQQAVTASGKLNYDLTVAILAHTVSRNDFWMDLPLRVDSGSGIPVSDYSTI